MELVDDHEFEEIVDAAVKTIPEEFSEKIENVAIVVADNPTVSQMSKLKARNHHVLLLGLYEGIPRTKRSYYGVGGQLPDKITIFKRPIETISPTKVDLIINIRNTIIHEIAHHFGMDEVQVRQAEAVRRKRMSTGG